MRERKTVELMPRVPTCRSFIPRVILTFGKLKKFTINSQLKQIKIRREA